MSEVNYYMGRYNIMLEDINLVTLNLIIAIMYTGSAPDMN